METKKDSRADHLSQPWIDFLDKELESYYPEHGQYRIYKTLKDLLSSATELSLAAAAQQIDICYQETLDPLLKRAEDKGFAGFLNSLYESISDAAIVIPYNHPLQDVLIEFIAEIRKLPAREAKIWDEDSIVYAREPIFLSVIEDNWNGYFPVEYKNSGPNIPSYETRCTEWVNFSAFLARCIQAGLNDNYELGTRYPSIDIPKGLEEEHIPGVGRSCFVRVATQYILLAGPKLCKAWLEDDLGEQKRWATDKWKVWAEKLDQFADNEDLDADLRVEAREAHEKMVYLRPDLF
ncbi:hypothetical protein F5Y04DRAFT_218933 [Hypomontagnella monticulosa]|nr:hypothetical protein F5Y04DRAFT_218933 [Hypomontagnella monticulosa]